jgi:purine-binding chemotaxis protein CheW
MTGTYLTFLLHGELYAIQVDKVLEVLEKQELTLVPNAPEVILGVLNFRGNVVPVYQTCLVLNLTKLDDNSNYFIIILELDTESGSINLGAIVDKVKGVIQINDDEIKSVPPMNKEYNAEVIKGIVKYKDDYILIMDVDKLFAKKDAKNQEDAV